MNYSPHTTPEDSRPAAGPQQGLSRRASEELGLAADPQWWELQPGEPTEDWTLRTQSVLAATWHCVEAASRPQRRPGQPAQPNFGPAFEAHMAAVRSRLRAIRHSSIEVAEGPEAG